MDIMKQLDVLSKRIGFVPAVKSLENLLPENFLDSLDVSMLNKIAGSSGRGSNLTIQAISILIKTNKNFSDLCILFSSNRLEICENEKLEEEFINRASSMVTELNDLLDVYFSALAHSRVEKWAFLAFLAKAQSVPERMIMALRCSDDSVAGFAEICDEIIKMSPDFDESYQLLQKAVSLGMNDRRNQLYLRMQETADSFEKKKVVYDLYLSSEGWVEKRDALRSLKASAETLDDYLDLYLRTVAGPNSVAEIAEIEEKIKSKCASNADCLKVTFRINNCKMYG